MTLYCQPFRPWKALFVIFAVLATAGAFADDELELLNGSKFRGKLVKEAPEAVIFNCGGAEMKVDSAKVRALVINGVRKEIHGEDPAAAAKAPPPPANSPAKTAPPAKAAAATAAAGVTHTKDEIEAIIQKAGETPENWFDSVKLQNPASLDLNWKAGQGGKGDPTKNLSDFMWQTIMPNSGRWKEGIKLLHQALNVNKANAGALNGLMNSMGDYYVKLFADYARGAYWFKKAGSEGTPLAECYCKLGNNDVARQILEKGNKTDAPTIRLWAEIGDLDKALTLAKGLDQALGNYLQGECLRMAGRWEEAKAAYQKVVDLPANDKLTAYHKSHAQSALDAVKQMEIAADISKVSDGVFNGTAQGYSGPVTMTVTVQGGKIKDVKASTQRESRPFSAITVVPDRIILKQAVKGVDAFSSATVTSDAIINATAKALATGVK